MAIFKISVLLSLPAISSTYEGRFEGFGMSSAHEVADILLEKLTQNQRSMIQTLVRSNVEIANALSAILVAEDGHRISEKDTGMFTLEIANRIFTKTCTVK